MALPPREYTGESGLEAEVLASIAVLSVSRNCLPQQRRASICDQSHEC